MQLEKKLLGKYVYLRSVVEGDAAFICEIRGDENLCQYVHPISPDIEAQRDWIRAQIARDDDYYFIVCSLDGSPVGLASIYNIDKEKRCAEFGRWVSAGNALQNVESVILSFDFAFENLGLDYVYMRTMMDNGAVRGFWARFGAESRGELFEEGLRLEKEVVTSVEYYEKLRDKSLRLLRR